MDGALASKRCRGWTHPDLLHSSVGRALTGQVSFIVQLVEHCEKNDVRIDLLQSTVGRALREKMMYVWSIKCPNVLGSSVDGAVKDQVFFTVPYVGLRP